MPGGAYRRPGARRVKRTGESGMRHVQLTGYGEVGDGGCMAQKAIKM